MQMVLGYRSKSHRTPSQQTTSRLIQSQTEKTFPWYSEPFLQVDDELSASSSPTLLEPLQLVADLTQAKEVVSLVKKKHKMGHE